METQAQRGLRICLGPHSRCEAPGAVLSCLSHPGSPGSPLSAFLNPQSWGANSPCLDLLDARDGPSWKQGALPQGWSAQGAPRGWEGCGVRAANVWPPCLSPTFSGDTGGWHSGWQRLRVQIYAGVGSGPQEGPVGLLRPQCAPKDHPYGLHPNRCPHQQAPQEQQLSSEGRWATSWSKALPTSRLWSRR